MNVTTKLEVDTRTSPFSMRYDNFINGEFRAPNAGATSRT